MSDNNNMKFTEKMKSDKKFRFEFIIGIWSGVVALALVVALCVIVKIFVIDNDAIDSGEDVVMENPGAVTEQAIRATETEPPYDNAIVSGNEEDFGFEDDNEDLKSATTAYATTVVNLRSEPALTASVIAKLNSGDEVKILEYGEEWTKVEFEGKEGYISTAYLSVTKPSEQPVYTARPSATKAPKNTPRPTKKPKATKKPKKTQKPVVTKEPQRTEEPVVTKEPQPDPTKAPQPDPTKAPQPDPTKAPQPDPTKVPDADVTEVPEKAKE